MTEKIRSRPFQFGNEKESSWPPLNGTAKTGRYYWHEDIQKMLPYPPKRKEKIYGEAPMFFSDSMQEIRHPKTGEVTNSRSRWAAIDKANGCITTGPNEKAHTPKVRDQKKEDAEMIGRIKRAQAMIDAGTAPLSERTRERCKQQNELVSSALGFDASNVLGRKNGRKRKR